MKYIQLTNGEKIPQIGLGVYQTPDGQSTINSVKWALGAGYWHIDTAKIYQNEESVAQGIKDSQIDRKDIFITTKLWNEDIRNRNTRKAFEESLKKLQTNYIDLYLIHWPAQGFEEAWAVLEELYLEGKIKSIGVSNFQKHHLEKLNQTAKIKPLINQIESHPYFNNQELINYCLNNQIEVEVWSPLGGTGGNLLKDETLNTLATKYNKTVAQIVLRWDIQRNVIVLPKSTHQDRIISNLNIFDFELNKEDMEIINQLNKDQRVGPDPDNFSF